jgi:hypothetical protein
LPVASQQRDLRPFALPRPAFSSPASPSWILSQLRWTLLQLFWMIKLPCFLGFSYMWFFLSGMLFSPFIWFTFLEIFLYYLNIGFWEFQTWKLQESYKGPSQCPSFVSLNITILYNRLFLCNAYFLSYVRRFNSVTEAEHSSRG